MTLIFAIGLAWALITVVKSKPSSWIELILKGFTTLALCATICYLMYIQTGT